VGDPDLGLKDLEEFDLITAQLTKDIEAIDAEYIFSAKYGDLNFTATLSDGTKVELKKGGSTEIVTLETRHEFTRLLIKARLEESKAQIAAIRKGISAVIPIEIIRTLTWEECEGLANGHPNFDVEQLKHRTSYQGSLTATSPVILKMWEVLTEFAPEERGKFLRFVYGQARLPPAAGAGGYGSELNIENLERYGSSADAILPEAQTCSFKLKLPAYSTKDILRNKLLYAITHCTAIDADFSASTQWDSSDLATDEQEEGEGKGDHEGDEDGESPSVADEEYPEL